MALSQTLPEVDSIWYRAFIPPARVARRQQDDLVIGSENKPRGGIVYHPLFRFEVLARNADRSRLKAKRYLVASDFAKERSSLIRCPEERIDLIRRVLGNPPKSIPGAAPRN